MSNTPDYLEVNDDHVIITLKKGADIDGAHVQVLTMQEPTVQNRLDMEAQKGTDADRELFMFSALCGIAPSDFHKFSLRDYGRVQKAFENFMD